MTVKEIVEAYLEANGYDGLYTCDCGCRIGDLMPCPCEGCDKCEPGYLRTEQKGDEHFWFIGPEAEASNEKDQS